MNAWETFESTRPEEKVDLIPKRMGRQPGDPFRNPGQTASQVRKKRTEKDLYEETIEQVWRVLRSRDVEPELKAKYHFAILRWQGKLDAVDEKHLDELKKLMEKKAS